MKLFCNGIFWCIAVTLGVLVHAESRPDLIARKLMMDIPIRVLLEEKTITQPFQWRIESPQAFFLFSPENKKKKMAIQAPVLTITYQKGSFFVNGIKQAADHFFIVPLQDPISFRGNSFDGVFAVTHSNGICYLVNHLDIEEYVLSVIPHESLQGWPAEVQKAFCISFRSYGISKVLEHRTSQEKNGKVCTYDIKNTNAHQVYKGNLRSIPFKKFVEDTRGIILVHNKKPVLAMFDICCGGIIPAWKKGIDFSKAPYLKRNYACTFCTKYKFYSWQCTYSYERIEKELKKLFPNFGTLRDIWISSYDDAGVALQIKCRSGHKCFMLTASKFKSLFKELRSLCITFKKSNRMLTVEGRGYGHLWGLCQRGAVEMVNRGHDYKSILKFYYPGTSFMRLQKNGVTHAKF